MVIGATNNPDALDEAFRRPGRFDHEIEIGIPNPRARLDIIETLLAKTIHSITKIELKTLADKTHGYVGADLASIIKESAISLLRDIHTSKNLRNFCTITNLFEN